MNNSDTRAAWDYHDQTKHSYWSVRTDPHYLDWANQPIPFKIYPDLEPIPLPREWNRLDVPALSTISTVGVGAQEEVQPTLNDLARLLYFSAGITRRKSYSGGEIIFRAASCTGALYEIELYIVCGDLSALAAGVYHFNPGDFSFRQLRKGDYRGVLAGASAGENSIVPAPLVIICTGTYWRNAWKYRARTYRHFGWDNGTLLANLMAESSALRFPARIVLGFTDAAVNQLLDLDTEREVSLSLVSIGRTRSKVAETHPPLKPLNFAIVPLSKSEVDYPAMRGMHAATALKSRDEVLAWRDQSPAGSFEQKQGQTFKLRPYVNEEMPSDSLDLVIARRGSSRKFERTPLTFEQFSTILHRASQGVPADFVEPAGASLNDWYLIVHAVQELPAGGYVFHRQSQELELLREGNFRAEAGHLGLEQELPADASADVFFLADLASILERFGNRGYRAVQLEAGILGGKLYLAAYAQRLGATGLTFYDDEVIDFFSPHARGKSAIFLMALGHGRKREIFR